MTKRTIITLTTSVFFAFAAQAQNLIRNASFESPAISSDKFLRMGPDAWTPGSTPGFLFNGDGGLPSVMPRPQHGQQYVDIGNEPPFTLSQEFTITNEGFFALQWFDSAGHDAGLTTSPYSVLVLTGAVEVVMSNRFDAYHSEFGAWVACSNQLALRSGTYTLRFQEEGILGGLDSLVDNVSLERLPDVRPFIVAQPQNRTNASGSTATFIVAATGTAPLSYQWQKNGFSLSEAGSISGTTTNLLTLVNVLPGDAADYTVVVANSYGSVTSLVATLTVMAGQCVLPPAGLVGWWPGDGNFQDLAGTHNGTGKNGVGFAPGVVGQAFNFNGTNSYVDLGNDSAFNLGQFTVETWAYLAPSLGPDQAGALMQKGSGWSCDGGFGLWYDSFASAGVYGLDFEAITGCSVFSAAYVDMSHAPIGFYHIVGTFDGHVTRLYTNGILAATGNWIDYVGFNSYPLRIGDGASDLSHWGPYYFWSRIDEASLYNRALTDSEIAAIYAAGSAGKCKLSPVPTITSHPQGRTNIAGTSATFSVTATSEGSLSYQWRKNGSNLSDAGNTSGTTTNLLTVANVQAGDEADYAVVVRNLAGAVTSTPPAHLTVLVPPVISSAPQGQTVLGGTKVTFNAGVSGSVPFAYQWCWNGTNISGATSSTLTFNSVQPDNAGTYSVVVTNLAGAVTSSPPAVLNLTFWR